MKLKMAGLCSVALLACASVAGPAFAGAMNWDFFTLTGSPTSPGYVLGPSATWIQGGVTLQAAAGVQCGASCWFQGPENLYAKNGGSAAEQGLGLTQDPSGDNEISNPFGIGLFLNEGHFSSVTMGSVQAGETWSVWGWNNSSGWAVLGSGMGNGKSTVVDFNSPILSGYNELVVSDPFAVNQTGATQSNDIVLMSVTTVPEPGTLALFAAGLLGCALFLRRARQH